MIRSMTGFGRSEIHEDDRRYTVEIKTVNHRYLEANIKMPKALSIFESSIRTILKYVCVHSVGNIEPDLTVF